MQHTTHITYPYELHRVSVHDGVEIAYMDEGQSDTTLLFIHGLANYAPVWKYQLEQLKNTARCIAIDLPGSGFSSKGKFPYSMFFYAESVVRFIEKMQLKRVVLCGHSMGGQIALIVALRYPHLIDKLVLVAPSGLEYFTPHEVVLMKHMMSMGSLFYSDEFHLDTAIRQSFYHKQNESSTIVNELKTLMQQSGVAQWREMCTASINGMLNEQIQQFLHLVTVPVLILFGEKDVLIPNTLIHIGETPKQVATKAAALIPDCTLKMIPLAGHFVQIEKAAEVNGHIVNFI